MKKRICFVVSSPSTARSFLSGHIKALSAKYEVDLVANFSESDASDFEDLADKVFNIKIERKISFLSDFKALVKLYIFFRRKKYLSVHSVTPKAGLLAMAASFLAGVSFRHHTYTGQVWVTKKGFSRWILKRLDSLMFNLSTYVLVDSPSQRSFLIRSGVIDADRSSVLASGSISGVNLSRFKVDIGRRLEVRESFGFSNDDVVFLFLGRINHDKGIKDLVDAFYSVSAKWPCAKLMIVGPEEDGVLAALDLSEKSIFRVGFTKRPEDFFNAADVFCLPSYREGFGSVIIEAAACGIPSLASNIYGISDAVENGITGVLHEPSNVDDIARGMVQMLSNASWRKRLGTAALMRAVNDFDSRILESSFVNFYESILVKND